VKAVVLLDDLSVLKGERRVAAGSFRFGWDGEDYEVDLTEEHADTLFQHLKPYIDAARKVRRQGPRPAVVPQPQPQPQPPRAIEAEFPMMRGVLLRHCTGKSRTELREYLRRHREWMSAKGTPVGASPNDTYYYYKKNDLRAYEAFLDASDVTQSRAALSPALQVG